MSLGPGSRWSVASSWKGCDTEEEPGLMTVPAIWPQIEATRGPGGSQEAGEPCICFPTLQKWHTYLAATVGEGCCLGYIAVRFNQILQLGLHLARLPSSPLQTHTKALDNLTFTGPACGALLGCCPKICLLTAPSTLSCDLAVEA